MKVCTELHPSTVCKTDRPTYPDSMYMLAPQGYHMGLCGPTWVIVGLGFPCLGPHGYLMGSPSCLAVIVKLGFPIWDPQGNHVVSPL